MIPESSVISVTAPLSVDDPMLFSTTSSRKSAGLTREEVIGGVTGGRFGDGAGIVLSQNQIDSVVQQFGIRVYELMLYDAAVSCAFALWKAGVLGDGIQATPRVIRSTGEIVSKRKARSEVKLSQEISDSTNRVMDALEEPIDQVAEEMLDGFAFGSSLAENTYDFIKDGPDKGKLAPTSIVPKPRNTWNFKVDAFNRIVAIRGWTGKGWEDLDRGKFSVFTWKPKNRDPRGRSGFRSAYNPWNMKLQQYPEYGEYLHHFAQPSIAVTAGETAETTFDTNEAGQRVPVSPLDIISDALENYANRAHLALPYGSTVTIVQSQGNGEAYHKGFDRFDMEIFRAILFSARPVQEAKFGSKGDTESGMDLVDLAFRAGRWPLCRMFEADIFYRYILLNWGKEVADRHCPQALVTAQNSVSSSLLAAFAAAYNAGFIDEAQLPVLWTRLGLPPIDDEAMTARLERRAQATDPANGQNTKKSEDAKNPKGPGTSQGKPQKPAKKLTTPGDETRKERELAREERRRSRPAA